MELPFENLDKEMLVTQRNKLIKYNQDMKAESQEKQVLKTIMSDLLKLQFSLEDNLLLIKQLKCFEAEDDQKNSIVITARQQIDTISTVNQLGNTWLNHVANTDNRGEVKSEDNSEQEKFIMLVDVKMDLDEIDMSTEDDDRLNDNSVKNDIQDKELLPPFMELDDTVIRKVLNEAKDNIKEDDLLELKSKKMNKCDQREFFSSSVLELDKHEARKHKPGIALEENKDDLFCESCGYVGVSLNSLINHKWRLHNNNPFPCDLCKRSYKTKFKLERHQKKTHKVSRPDSSNPSLTKCDDCDFFAQTIQEMNKHIEVYHLKRCEKCEVSVKTEAQLKNHINRCHMEIEFPCDKCNYVGKNKVNLVAHKKGKHGNKTIMCDKCDYSCNLKQLLIRHIEFKHEGITYPCDECDYVGPRSSSVAQHKETRHKRPQYLCDQCDYAATLPTFLKAHIESTHEKIRYPCSLCDHASTSKSNLRQHIRRVHKVNPE